MATKSKSNVAKSAKKSTFKFKWWMAVIGVAVIALVGVVVIRLSHAGSYPSYTSNAFNCPSAYGIPTQSLSVGMNTATGTFGTASFHSGCVGYLQYLLTTYQNGSSFKTNINVYADGNPGYFGQQTLSLTKQFQTQQGLAADGIVGGQTWAALVKACYVNTQCSQSGKSYYAQ